MQPIQSQALKNTETIILGGGCFWCVDAVYRRIPGVLSSECGYAGGDLENPRYEAVCQGDTGHTEVVKVTYQPELISLEGILDIFWEAHDPTTMNRQGDDVGFQYRSVIYYFNEDQKTRCDASMVKVSLKRLKTIVTEILPYRNFYPAEEIHQDYFNQHQNAGYCRMVILPKLQKLDLE